MGQFKPMVKMMTDEPSVILKLKKGGKVMTKAAGQAESFRSMASNNPKVFEDAENGVAPKKPSMAERRRAMNPNMYAKGGKVAHKDMGGAMMMRPGMVPGASAPSPMPMQAMGRAALMNMAPAQRMKRAGMVQKALSGMKDGGSAECKALEKELKHHESMSASKAHGKAGGGKVSTYAKTKMDMAHKDSVHGTGEVKEGKPGGYAMGGSIMGNEKAYENTKMHTAKRDTAHGTGGIKEANAGGYAKGGRVPGLGNAIEGGNWENRPANSAKPGKVNGTTGGVKEANGGGYKMGGRASKKAYATGGQVVDDGKAVKMPAHAISRPVANSLQSGTFAKGGKVKFAEGGSEDLSKGGYDAHYANEKKENEAMRESILGAPKRAYDAIRGMISSTPTKPPAGSVTKTEKSVTVSPASKKRGGSAMC